MTRTEWSISAILEVHSRSPKRASCAPRSELRAKLAAAPFESLDLRLAGKESCVRRVGRVQADRVAGELISVAVDEHGARRKLGTRGLIGAPFDHVDLRQPIGERATDA